MSKIEWTEKTWNPVTGCAKVSAGCKHCYAEAVWLSLHQAGGSGLVDSSTLMHGLR